MKSEWDGLDIDVKVLRLQPGDVLAIRVADELSVEQAERLKEMAEHGFGCRAVVLSGGIDLVAVREAEPV